MLVVSYMMNKIKDILIGSKVALEVVFNDFCSDRMNQRMSDTDFRRFVKKYIDKAADHEVDSLFRHFAGADPVAGIARQLTLQDFQDAFGREVQLGGAL